jgi:hypothetical protein
VVNYLHDAFISFAWRDLKRARSLHEQLKARGFVTWYAEQDLRGGDDMPASLWAGLEKSRFVFVVHSKHYDGAPWAGHELSVATADEVTSKMKKIVFLTFDDAKVPYGVRQKLYIDFRDRKTRPLERLIDVMNEASEGVIRGIAAAMLTAPDLPTLRECSHRLSAIARLREEDLVLQELGNLATAASTPRHVLDSVAWAIGDIGMAEISESFAKATRDLIERCLSKGDKHITAHIAWIAGEMTMAARTPGMKAWANTLIAIGETSSNPVSRQDFIFTRTRVSSPYANGSPPSDQDSGNSQS